MSKGQPKEFDTLNNNIKNFLKFLKLNENLISTVLGVVVIFVVAGMVFNYFKTSNWNSWKEMTKQNTEDILKSDEAKIKDKYVVKKGDHLWKIAEERYGSGYNYVDIVKENKLSSKEIVVGQELKLPEVKPKKLTKKSVTPQILATNTDIIETKITDDKTSTEYTVVRGDSYWKIATEKLGNGYRWVEIYNLNKTIFKNPGLIHAGVKIVLPKK